MKRFSYCLVALILCGFTNIKNENTVKIKTPDLAERKTAKIQLDNGLQAYIISDPGAEQSAAALAVTAGSWQDSEQYPGIAHYLEHLLFLGNEKYPQEDQFMGYVKSNGGIVNAYTSTDRTVYMFSINNNVFDSALDQFSHFFIDPLFNPSGVKRELHAVDQENAKNIENDGWRSWMIFKATGNPKSPNAKFSTGNAETLGKIPPSEVRQWWEEHYTASQMHLVVYSNQPLDELIKVVNEDFGPIANRKVDNEIANMPLTSEHQMGHMLYIEPIKDLRQLSLTWELPAWAIENQGEKIPQIIAYVLENGSDNSLEASLKRDELAEYVSAGVEPLSKTTAIFELNVALTKQGVIEVDTVIDRCFQTLALLKENGISQSIFDDQAKIAKINYQWQTRQNPFHYTMDIAGKLPYENLSTFPASTDFYTSYQPKKISKLLQSFTPSTCVFKLVAPATLTGIEPNREEKWLGGKYAIKPIPDQTLVALAHAEPNPAIGMPAPNPYIPEDLTILTRSKEQAPIKLTDDSKGVMYFSDAANFPVPEIAWTISFKSPLIDGTPKHTVLTSLFTRAFQDQLTSPLFYASNAGLNLSIYSKDLKLTMQLSGFSPKAHLLLKDALTNIKELKPSEAQFNIYKESRLSQIRNAQKSMPFSMAIAQMHSLIFNDFPMLKAQEKALEKITYNDFLEFAQTLTQQLYTEAMLAGNLSETDAKNIWHDINKALSPRDYPLADQNEKKVFLLSNQNGPYAVNETTEMQGNVAMLLIEQGAFSYKRAAAQEILGTALSEDFFKTLRTEQQTGYIAKGWSSRVADELLQFFSVQSATHDPDDLLARFELFLETFVKDFHTQFSEERFTQMQQGVVTTLTNPPTNLFDYENRMNTFAFDKEADFQYLDNIAKSAQELTYDEIHEYALEFFSRSNKKRLALLMQGAPTSSQFTYKEVTALSLKKWQK
ncbi:MAG: insulinase family protein [Chlamydiales bacterium]|nr:insulinase family protein [Chlamydiales bacterium]